MKKNVNFSPESCFKNRKIRLLRKIYSFHEPEVHCIGKGKANKKYEFGSKFGILWSKERGIILSGADCENGYDGHTLEKIVKVHNEISGIKLTDIYCDRGYRGKKRKN